jgi:hypothetical protein
MPFSQVLISEIMIDPSCVPEQGQWIELFNAGNMPVQLSGYKIDDDSSSQVTLRSHILNAGDYYIVASSEQGCGGLNADANMTIVLSTTDTLTVKDGYGNVVDTVAWTAISLGSLNPSTGGSIRRKTNADGTPVDTGDFANDWEAGAVGGSPRAGFEFAGPARLTISPNGDYSFPWQN